MQTEVYGKKFLEPLERENRRDGITVTLNHRGIGDLITCAYSIAGIKASTDLPVTWSVVKERQDWAALFLDADEIRGHTRPDRFSLDRFEKGLHRFEGRHSLNADFTRHHQYAKKLNTTPRKPRMVTPEPYDWSKHGLSVPPVLIVPQSTQRMRMWSRDPKDTDSNWVDLAQMLESEGVPVVALTNLPFYRSVKADTPKEMLSIINSVPLVVSVDTGPAHVAGMLGKHCISLCGADSGEGVFGFYDNARPIQGELVAGKQCSPCLRHAEVGWQNICDTWCQALADIPVRRVFDEVVNILMGTPHAQAN